MNTIYLTIILCSISLYTYSQEYEFDIHQRKLNDLIRLEEQSGSKLLENTSMHMLPAGIAQPLTYRRKQSGIPDLTVQYFYFEKDSVLHYILYEWDESNFVGHRENDKKSKEFQQNLIQKYTDIQQLITKKFGQSKIEGELNQLSKSEKRGGLNRKDIWHPNDSMEIEMYTAISNYYEKKGMITINPTHRIRLYVRNTQQKEELAPKLTQPRIDSLNIIAQNLFQALADKRFDYSKQFLSDMIIDQVTKEQFQMLSNSTDFTKKYEVFFSGVQVGLDGTAFTILQYKASNEINLPPKDIIKVVFDSKGKVAGIQPMKRD